MPILPTAVPAADLASWKSHKAISGPKPPGEGPLARLIVSSLADRSTEPPDSVRAAQSAAIVHVLIRKRQQILSSAPLQAAYRAAGWPNIVQVLTRQIQKLRRVA